MKLTYAHWRDVPAAAWRWPNFSPEEIACRGSGRLVVDEAAMDALQRLRDTLGAPLIVTSGYRSPAHNRAEGGKPGSRHLVGEAFDVSMANHDPRAFYEAAIRAGFKAFGHYPRSNFMHVDMGPRRTWTAGVESWPERATRFAPEAPPARESLSESRTMAGSGAAGLGTAGAAGIEAIQGAIGEATGVLSTLAPHLDTIRWVCIGLTLIGVAVVIYARLDDWKRGRR